MCIVDPLKWVNKWSLQLSTLRCIMMQNHYMNSKSDSYSPEWIHITVMNPHCRKKKLHSYFTGQSWWTARLGNAARGVICYLPMSDSCQAWLPFRISPPQLFRWKQVEQNQPASLLQEDFTSCTLSAIQMLLSGSHSRKKKHTHTDDPHTHHPVTCWDMHRNRNAAVPKTIAILLHLMSGNQQLIRPIKNTQFWDLLT